MSRSSGTYTAPTSGWKPAVEGSVIDSSDWNTLLDDIEAAVTESVYTGGLGATDNAVVRTDGTDTKKAQGSTPTISDTGILSGVATFTLTAYTIGTLPAGTEGQIAYASDWDKNGGASSGSLVFHDGEAWRGVDTGTTSSGVAPPYNTVLPVISGTTTEGQTLSTTDGTWLQSPTSYAYQWKRNGVAIGGATSNTYVLVDADAGTTITATVTATNAGGSTDATSAGVGPITDADSYFSNVVLLLSGDGTDGATTTTDESPTTPHTVTFNGNAQIDTAQKKFGTASYLFDGTGDYLSIPSNADFQLANSFTVELWVRFNVVAGASFISKWPSTAGINEWTFNYNANTLTWWLYFANTATQVVGSWTPSANTWYHICADRESGGPTRVYVNGVMIAKNTSVTTTSLQTGVTAVNIGRQSDGTAAFNGWIDEIRVTKGIARYASDSGFTVPTAAYPRT